MNIISYAKIAAAAVDITQPLSGQKFTFFGILSNVATWFLWLAGALAFIYLIYGGIVYISAAGNEERTKVGRSAILSAVVGLVLIALAYIMVNWIFNMITTAGPK